LIKEGLAMFLKAALFVHIISAVFWIGGMLFLTLVVAPYLMTVDDPQQKARVYQAVGRRFRLLGWVAIAALLSSGPAVLYALYGVHPLRAYSPGLSPGFDLAVRIKLALVAVIVLSSLVHDFWIGPRARSSPAHTLLARVLGRGNLLVALAIAALAVIIRAGGL
jgi:putative copper export protein